MRDTNQSSYFVICIQPYIYNTYLYTYTYTNTHIIQIYAHNTHPKWGPTVLSAFYTEENRDKSSDKNSENPPKTKPIAHICYLGGLHFDSTVAIAGKRKLAKNQHRQQEEFDPDL